MKYRVVKTRDSYFPQYSLWGWLWRNIPIYHLGFEDEMIAIEATMGYRERKEIKIVWTEEK